MTRPTPLTSSELDRLVDGELSPEETRDLLEVIEETPGGWKKCALAFLEAQAWQQTLRTLAASPTRPRTEQRSQARRRWPGAVLPALTTLAAMLLGIVLGSRLHPDAANPHQATGTSPSARSGPPLASSASPVSSDGGPWQLVVDSSAGRAIVPVYSPTDRRLAEAWEEDTGHWWMVLREAGVPIDERQRWYGVALGEGRQVWLPVREVRWRGGISNTRSPDLNRRLQELAGDWPDDPVVRQVRRWLQEPPPGESVCLLRIGPGVIIESEQGLSDDSSLAERLDRLEQDLQNLQQRLRQVLAKRRRPRTGQSP